MTEKHLWEVTYKSFLFDNTFRVITKYKNVTLVANAISRYFLESDFSSDAVKDIQYIGEVFE